MLGIAIARELAGSGRSVTLFEASTSLGGLAGSWTIDDLTWDRYYHVTLASDRSTRALLADAGVESRLVFRPTTTGYWDGNRVHPTTTVREFLALPGLSAAAKLRIGATIGINARRRDWKRIERSAVEPWLRRWSGRRATERFWDPQLRAKFGDDHHDIAASLLWATFRRLDGARRGVERREQMGYVRGGYAHALREFERLLRELEVEIRVGAPVVAIDAHADGSGAAVTTAGDDHARVTVDFDDVVVTLAAPLVAPLIRSIDPIGADAFGAVRSMGVVCAAVVLDRPLSPHYLTYLAAPSPLTAVVDMSALIDADERSGRGLIYLPRYAAAGSAVFNTDDATLEREWLDALATVYPAFDRSRVRGFAVARSPHVFAVPGVGYSARVPPLTVHPRVHAISSAHLVHATLNVDETVALGTWAARELAELGRSDRDRLLSRP